MIILIEPYQIWKSQYTLKKNIFILLFFLLNIFLLFSYYHLFARSIFWNSDIFKDFINLFIILLKFGYFVLQLLYFSVKFDNFLDIGIFFFPEFSIQKYKFLFYILFVVKHILNYQGKTISFQFHMIK